MSAPWSRLGADGQLIAARRFAERDAAERMHTVRDAGVHRITLADLYAWATDPECSFGRSEREALLRDPALRRSFALLVARIASLRVAPAAAASSGQLKTRSGPGVEVRLIPSRAEPAQIYVLLKVDQAVAASILLVLRDGVPVARLALPKSADGHVQLVEAADSPAVTALRDPATELVLM